MKEEYMEEIELEKVKDENEENLRVLVPVVIYGPNNQYQGFRESIMIAKILNRKVDFNYSPNASFDTLFSTPRLRRCVWLTDNNNGILKEFV